jgi:hypothetical protein
LAFKTVLLLLLDAKVAAGVLRVFVVLLVTTFAFVTPEVFVVFDVFEDDDDAAAAAAVLGDAGVVVGVLLLVEDGDDGGTEHN